MSIFRMQKGLYCHHYYGMPTDLFMTIRQLEYRKFITLLHSKHSHVHVECDNIPMPLRVWAVLIIFCALQSLRFNFNIYGEKELWYFFLYKCSIDSEFSLYFASKRDPY